MITGITLLALCCVFSISTFAQTSDAEAWAIVNLLGVQKKEIIAQLVPVPEKIPLLSGRSMTNIKSQA
jgi:hypothetical protein